MSDQVQAMNEQVRVLATIAINKSWNFHPLREKKVTEFSDDEVTRFAELIIKECTTMLRDTDWFCEISNNENYTPNDIAVLAASSIEEYFGVK